MYAGMKFFPPGRKKAGFFKVGAYFLVSAFTYNIWRMYLQHYFRIADMGMRVAVGSAAPHMLGLTVFELYVHLGCRSLSDSDVESATLVIMVPLIFMLSATAVTQLGAADLASGACVELGSALIEVAFKHCLLSGETPCERAWRLSRGACCAIGRGVPVELACVGVVPTGGSEGSEAEAPKANGDSARKRALIVAVLISNMTEIIVHTLVAGLYIFARVNPNAAQAPPTPQLQVFTLFCLKISFETVTDIFIGAAASRAREYQHDAAEGLVDCLTKETQVLIGVMSAIFGVELLTNILAELCPYAADGVELLSLGLCT